MHAWLPFDDKTRDPLKGRIIPMRLSLCIVCTALVCVFVTASGSIRAAQSPTGINVKDFGAVGDGKADDTAAIQRAIDEGKAKKLPVLFPKDIYRVTKPFVIENQSLMGAEPGGWPADSGPMPTLLVDHDSGPAVTMRSGASVHGLMFVYDERKKPSYPPTISLAGGGISISNVRLQYCTDGIISDGTSNCGRLNIENVFMVSPGGVGLYVSRTYDIATLRNIEVWNNLNRPNVTAFKFGQNDGMRASQLMAFGVQTGFELADDPNGGTWATFAECGTDACVHGWKAEGKTGHTVSITGGYFWDHFQTLLIKNPNVCMRVANAEMQSNGAPVVDAQACRHLLLTGCRIGRAFANPQQPFIDLQAVDCFTMSGCVIAPLGPVFSLGKGLKQAAITGNVFENSQYERFLKDERAKDADIVVANNSGMKPTPKHEPAGAEGK